MSNSKSRSSVSRKNKQSRRNNRIYRSLLMTFVIAGSNLLSALPLLAETPGTVINNQATGSFTDPANNDQEVLIESNVVQVTIAEVAGITVTPLATEEAPATVANPGPFQDNGKINPEDVVYFTYQITNVGNDPTQFFIPDAPSSINNGTLGGDIQIIGYDPDGDGGTNATDLSDSPIAIPNGSGGINTGDANALGPVNGSIGPNGTVTIRVPIKVNAGLADGDVVTAVMGDTDPVGEQNQDFAAGNKDVTTQDNPDGTAGEADGQPVNGVREASASQDVTVTNANSISGTLYEDAGGEDTGDNTFNTGETKLPADITVNLYEDTNGNGVLDDPAENTPVQTVETDANGDYVFPDVADGDYIVKVDETDTDIPEFYTPGTTEDLPVTVNGASETGKDFGFDKNAPDVVMVKRITKINDQAVNPNDSTALNSFVDDPNDDNDTSANWPANYVVGEINAGRVRVGDEIEYTIYFLNAGSFKAENLKICDAIQGQQDLKADAYGTDELQLNVSNNGDTGLTSDSGDDRAEFIAAGANVPANCNLQVANDNGTLVVDVTDATFTEVSGSTAPGTPNSYGLIRFTTVVRDNP